tara:strand:- start:10543 stop:10962 length:420 start_codon:yes stop_codon:yes gene_type:complete
LLHVKYTPKVSNAHKEKEMDSPNERCRFTENEVDSVCESLVRWTQRHEGVLVLATMLELDPKAPVEALSPQAFFAAEIDGFEDVELAALFAQLQAAISMVARKYAVQSSMGPKRFGQIVNECRTRMLQDNELSSNDDPE